MNRIKKKEKELSTPIALHNKNHQEAIYIRVNNPTLNRNVGKYNLPHICTPPQNLKSINTPLHHIICALEAQQLLVLTPKSNMAQYHQCTINTVANNILAY